MKLHHHLIAIALLLVVCAPAALAAHRVALLNFTTDDNSVRTLEAGSQCAAVIQAQLGNITDVTWVERAEFAELQQEISLSQSALVDNAGAIRLGRMLKADVILQGRFVGGESKSEKPRILRLEAVDLFRAELLSTRTIPVPGSLRDPVSLTPELLNSATRSAREILTEAFAKLRDTAARRTVAGLFVRNISANNRLDYLCDQVLSSLSSSTSQTTDLRWLNFPRTSESKSESRLVLLGLVSPDPAQWRSPADFFLWGTLEEKSGYAGPADQVPFTITLSVWDGSGELREFQTVATPADFAARMRDLAAKLLAFARSAIPQDYAAGRSAIARQVAQRSRELINERQGAGRALGSADRSRRVYANQLMDLALFLTPDDQELAYRSFFTNVPPVLDASVYYARIMTRFQQYIDHIERYKLVSPRGSGEFMTWSLLRSSLSQLLEIHTREPARSGLPYDLTPDQKRKMLDDILRRFFRATTILYNQRERFPRDYEFVVRQSDPAFLLAIVRSAAGPQARAELFELLWPMFSPQYRPDDPAQKDKLRDIRLGLAEIYAALGRPAPDDKLFSTAGEAETRLPSPVRPASPPTIRRKPSSAQPASVASRPAAPAAIRQKSAPVAAPHADRGPAANIPILPALFEYHMPLDFSSAGTLRTTSSLRRPSSRVHKGGPFADPYNFAPVGLCGHTIWLQGTKSNSLTNKVRMYEPALARFVTPPRSGNHDMLNITGTVAWRNLVLASSATEGLLIYDQQTRSSRALGGQQGLATSSLDAIVADGDAIYLAGSDKNGAGRIIHFNPVTERFTDLIVDLPANRQIWLYHKNLVYRDASGFTWRDLASGKSTSIADILKSLATPGAAPDAGDPTRIIGMTSHGLWLTTDMEILCLTEDRRSISARLPLPSATLSATAISEDLQYAFFSINPWSTAVNDLKNIHGESWLLILDLARNQWAGQCRIPSRPNQIFCAASRVWLSCTDPDQQIVINRADLGLRPGRPLPLAPDASAAQIFATAVYNADLAAVRNLLFRGATGTSDLGRASIMPEVMFSIAPEPALQLIMDHPDAWYRSGLPGSALFIAIHRNSLPLVNRLIQRGQLPELTDTPSARSALRTAIGLGNDDIIAAIQNSPIARTANP